MREANEKAKQYLNKVQSDHQVELKKLLDQLEDKDLQFRDKENKLV